MYLWNTDALVEDLKKDAVSEMEKFKYIFVYIMVSFFFIELLILFCEPSNNMDYVESFLDLAIEMGGLYACYWINQSGDNRNFIERFICLSIPISLRFLVALIGVGLILGYLLVSMGRNLDSQTGLSDLLYSAIWSSLFYWRLYVAIQKVSNKEIPGAVSTQEENI